MSVALMTAALVVGGCSSDDEDPSAQTTTTDGLTSEDPDEAASETALGSVTLDCQGEGSPVVVFLAGGTDPITTWDALIEELPEDAVLCRFDPGQSSQPVTATSRSNALASTLDQAGIDGPYLVVAHSLAGLTARQFGHDHSDELAGAVLLDPMTQAALLTLRPELEGQGWDVDAAQAELDAEVDWPDVPLVVLSRDPQLLTFGSEPVERSWSEGQQSYAALTPSGRQSAVAGSGHYVYRDAPTEVRDAIVELIAQVD